MKNKINCLSLAGCELCLLASVCQQGPEILKVYNEICSFFYCSIVPVCCRGLMPSLNEIINTWCTRTPFSLDCISCWLGHFNLQYVIINHDTEAIFFMTSVFSVPPGESVCLQHRFNHFYILCHTACSVQEKKCHSRFLFTGLPTTFHDLQCFQYHFSFLIRHTTDCITDTYQDPVGEKKWCIKWKTWKSVD